MDAVHQDDTAAGLVAPGAPAVDDAAGPARLPIGRRLVGDGRDARHAHLADGAAGDQPTRGGDGSGLALLEEDTEPQLPRLGEPPEPARLFVVERHRLLDEDMPAGGERLFGGGGEEVVRQRDVDDVDRRVGEEIRERAMDRPAARAGEVGGVRRVAVVGGGETEIRRGIDRAADVERRAAAADDADPELTQTHLRQRRTISGGGRRA